MPWPEEAAAGRGMAAAGRPPFPLYPPIVAAMFAAAMVALDHLGPSLRLIAEPCNLAGVPFVALGISTVLWAASLFRRAGTTIDPYGESRRLVTRGPYRLTRNPMYLGLLSGLIGLAIWLGGTLPFVLLPVFVWLITMRFIRREEDGLRRVFGARFDRYYRQVPRWL